MSDRYEQLRDLVAARQAFYAEHDRDVALAPGDACADLLVRVMRHVPEDAWERAVSEAGAFAEWRCGE